MATKACSVNVMDELSRDLLISFWSSCVCVGPVFGCREYSPQQLNAECSKLGMPIILGLYVVPRAFSTKSNSQLWAVSAWHLADVMIRCPVTQQSWTKSCRLYHSYLCFRVSCIRQTTEHSFLERRKALSSMTCMKRETGVMS